MGFFRRRQPSGVSFLLLFFGVFGLCTGCGGLVFGVPAGFVRAGEVRRMEQPSSAELDSQISGSTIIIAAQIPSDSPATDGFALFYTEERLSGTPTADNPDPSLDDRDWMRTEDRTDRLVLVMNDSREITVQFPTTVSFINAQERETDLDGGIRERTTRGYIPGQTLAIEGSWEGDNLLTAKTAYAGTVDEFVSYVGRTPYAVFGGSIFCLILSIAFLGFGGLLRLIRR